MANRKYDSTVARMAGNIAAGFADRISYISQKVTSGPEDEIVMLSVRIARAIVAEVERTEVKDEG